MTVRKASTSKTDQPAFVTHLQCFNIEGRLSHPLHNCMLCRWLGTATQVLKFTRACPSTNKHLSSYPFGYGRCGEGSSRWVCLQKPFQHPIA